jgi:hypothetical protein
LALCFYGQHFFTMAEANEACAGSIGVQQYAHVCVMLQVFSAALGASPCGNNWYALQEQCQCQHMLFCWPSAHALEACISVQFHLISAVPPTQHRPPSKCSKKDINHARAM